MLIDEHDIPNKMILDYCKIVQDVEKNFTIDKEILRTQLHDKIFNHAGCFRSLYRREDRTFDKELNETILDLTEV